MSPASVIIDPETQAGSHPTAEALDAELRELELQLYVRLDGLAERARACADAAREVGRRDLVRRAELVRSDSLSRRGGLDEALRLQRTIADAAADDGDGPSRARAASLLAATYFRLGLLSECQAAAEDGLRLLDDSCPAHWHVEHHMGFALWTSIDRAGAADFELFAESLRRARTLREPRMLLAVLNNYAWTAAQNPDALDRASRLVDEMELLIDASPELGSAPCVDTIAWVRLARGDVASAERLLLRALDGAALVEPDAEATISAHLATVRRRQGRRDEASALLEHARRTALRHSTPEVAVAALRELAEIDAERGDHRRAYRRLARFVIEQREDERVESERRATLLQSVYGTALAHEQRRYYENLAIRDPLTDLYNRRYVEQQLPPRLAAGGLVVAMFDVDHFKAINDTHSHDVGDVVLRQLGNSLREHAESLAADGFAARLGGEEFLIVAACPDLVHARASLERLRRRIAGREWSELPAGIRPTISGGVVFCETARGTTSEVLSAADSRLYEAKRAGRDRLMFTSF